MASTASKPTTELISSSKPPCLEGILHGNTEGLLKEQKSAIIHQRNSVRTASYTDNYECRV